MSKKLNTALATMLLLSSVAPLASAETVTEQDNQVIKVDQDVPLDIINNPATEQESQPDKPTSDETEAEPSTPEPEPTPESEQPTPEAAPQEQPTQEEIPDLTIPSKEDIEVDLTKQPYKDGIHFEIRYSSRDEKTGKPHIPTFKVAIVDTAGNPHFKKYIRKY